MCPAGARSADRPAVPIQLRTGARSCARMPVIADVLFRIDVGMVRVGRCVRATGLAVVVLQSKSSERAARVSGTGGEPGSVRAVVHHGRRDPDDPGTGGLHAPATDAEFSFTVCPIL